MRNLDIGLLWGKLYNIWMQLGMIQSVLNSIMIVGIFYNTILQSTMPFWLYIVLIAVVILALLVFVLKFGISGYFRFFSQQSTIDDIEKKIDYLTTLIEKRGNE